MWVRCPCRRGSDHEELARAVDGDADEKLVLSQELAPSIVDERGVGLERVVDCLAGGVFLLQCDHGAEEIDA